MPYCLYYQAKIRKMDCWFFVASLRSFEHVAFDRTCDVEKSIFEFFVPPSMEECFLAIMRHFQARGIVSDLVQLPNRFQGS